MISAFCPGHISSIFRPVWSTNPLSTGSIGVGIRLNLGATASVSERHDDKVCITVNGVEQFAPITRKALENMAPGQGLDVVIEHDLPMCQGFGTSASGTLAACLCLAEVMGFPDQLAYMSGHMAEIGEGGGLGDLPAMMSGYDVPIRVSPGIPPKGQVEDSGLKFDQMSVIIFDGGLETATIIKDWRMSEIIQNVGDEAMSMFMSERTTDNLFDASNLFSEKTGLETVMIKDSFVKLRSEGYRSAMCMLGNSVFTDAPVDVSEELFPEAQVIGCSSYGGKIQITQRE